MKKIIYFYIGLLSILLFTQFYNIEKNYDMFATLDFPFTIAEETDKQILYFETGIKNKEEFDLFINQYGQYCEENQKDSVIILIDSDPNGKIIKNNFTYISNKDVLNTFKLKDKSEIDFNSRHENRYYSTDINDKESYNTFLTLDPTILSKSNQSAKYLPFYKILDTSININYSQVGFYMLSDEPKTDFSDLKDHFTLLESSYVNSLETYEMHATWNEVYRDEIRDTNILIPITLIVLVLLLTTYIMKQNRKIMIHRIHGISTFKIMNRLYFPFIVTCASIFIIAIPLLYILIIGKPSNITQRLDRDLINLIFWYIISIIFSYLLILLYLKQVFSLRSLKSTANFKPIFKLNILAKISITIVFIIPFLNIANTTLPLINKYLSAIKTKDEILNTVILKGISNNKEEVFNELLKIGIYMDTSYYDVFKDIPDDPISQMHPFMSVNENYLKKFNLKNSDGSPLKLSTLNHGDILIPESQKKVNINEYCQTGVCTPKIIENGNEFFNYDPYYSRMKDPIIIFVKEYDYNMMFNEDSLFLPISEKKDIKYYDNIIKKLSPNQSWQLNSNAYRVENYFYETQRIIIKFSSLLFVYVAVYLSFIYQSTFILLDGSKKHFALQYIYGISKNERYRIIFISNTLIYIIPFLISTIFLKLPFLSVVYYIIGILVLEIITSCIMIRSFEKNKIASILKGEDNYE